MELPAESSLTLTIAYIHLKQYEGFYILPLWLYAVYLMGFSSSQVKGRLLAVGIVIYQLFTWLYVDTFQEYNKIYPWGADQSIGFGMSGQVMPFIYPFVAFFITHATCAILNWHNPFVSDPKHYIK